MSRSRGIGLTVKPTCLSANASSMHACKVVAGARARDESRLEERGYFEGGEARIGLGWAGLGGWRPYLHMCKVSEMSPSVAPSPHFDRSSERMGVPKKTEGSLSLTLLFCQIVDHLQLNPAITATHTRPLFREPLIPHLMPSRHLTASVALSVNFGT